MTATVIWFAAATVAVLLLGPRIARTAESLARRTGLGQALFGAVFLGATTSLPGIVFTITATASGRPTMAVSSALGGIVAQTTFVAIADLAFRRGVLARRVPTGEVAVQAAALMVLLALVVVGTGTPSAGLAGVHVITPILFVCYIAGLTASRHLGAEGGLGGTRGKKGQVEAPERGAQEEPLEDVPIGQLWLRFTTNAALLAGAGAVLSLTGGMISDQTGVSESAVGGALTAFATSTPELVTAIAAARSGAVGLAAGDIIGGNAFDTLFIAVADLVPGIGPIYGVFESAQLLLLGAALGLNGVLLEGLVRRGRQGPGWIGWESALVVLGYLAVVGSIFTTTA